ncbi:MAG: glutamate 5-kinase [Kiritimatiellae bacterium]|nr:glutamate 5-kinase [Kiritimatiellia bacterium]
MKTEEKYRAGIPETRRIVIKVGSRVLVQKNGRPDTRRMRTLVNDIARLRLAGKDVILVTSGAIAAGMQALKIRERPTKLPDLQMAAAVGQTRLMSLYTDMFAVKGYIIGQILLTNDNFMQRMRTINAKRTIENLLRNGVVPIINENDAITDEEIRADLALGDNDLLATLVSKLIRADLMLLLTTADGVRAPSTPGRTKRVSFIEEVNRKVMRLVTPDDNSLSKGGMASKLHAARDAAQSGCLAIIANGLETGIIGRVMKGEDVGTIVLSELKRNRRSGA